MVMLFFECDVLNVLKDDTHLHLINIFGLYGMTSLIINSNVSDMKGWRQKPMRCLQPKKFEHHCSV